MNLKTLPWVIDPGKSSWNLPLHKLIFLFVETGLCLNCTSKELSNHVHAVASWGMQISLTVSIWSPQSYGWCVRLPQKNILKWWVYIAYKFALAWCRKLFLSGGSRWLHTVKMQYKWLNILPIILSGLWFSPFISTFNLALHYLAICRSAHHFYHSLMEITPQITYYGLVATSSHF
jgi:hypothetical protein